MPFACLEQTHALFALHVAKAIAFIMFIVRRATER